MESVEGVLRGLTISTATPRTQALAMKLWKPSTTPGPIMLDMMDKLTISTPIGSAHQGTSEPKLKLQNNDKQQSDVSPVSSYLYPTRDSSWLEYSEYCCEFCGHRAPHMQLKMLHTRRHSSNHNDRRREMYSKRETRVFEIRHAAKTD